MSFSSRLPRELSANAISVALAELRGRQIPLLDLTESNPTRAGFDYPQDLLEGLSQPEALIYDPQPLGLSRAREAVAGDFARRGIVVSPERIALTASTSEAYALLFKLLCDPGDSVLVPRPSYPLFEHLTALEGIRAVSYELEYHGAWHIDLDSLRGLIDATTRALLVVSPNNPTGSMLDELELGALTGICVESDLALIGDEVFADFPLERSGPAPSVLSQSDTLTFALGGLSKSAGLPQVKLGWIAAGGPPDRVEQALRSYEIIADTYLSVSTPVQHAAAALIARGAEVRGQIQQRIARNLQALRAAAGTCPEVEVLAVEAGWSAVVRVPAYRSEEALVLELLQRDHVVVHPGYFFDFSHEAFLVISLLLTPDTFDRGVARMLARATEGVRS